MKVRKKPVVIDAFLIKGKSIGSLSMWVESFGDIYTDHFIYEDENLSVKTLEGTSYRITPEDVIMRGIKGEYYPCKVDIFKATYEEIDINEHHELDTDLITKHGGLE